MSDRTRTLMAHTPSILATALAAALLAACGEAPHPAAEVPGPQVQGTQLVFPIGHPQLAMLETATAAPSKSVTVELPARLVWNEDRTQRLYPAYQGRVSAIRVDTGQAVKPGTVLAQFASPDFGAAQADASKARADMQLARKALERQRELHDAGIVARKDLEQAETDAARAQAELARAQARTAMYGGGSGVDQHLALVAGVAGTVVERNLNPGQEVRPEQSGPGVPPLFVVSDPSTLWVQIDARESEAGTLRPGAEFALTIPALPNQRFTGHVMTTGDFIDPVTRTIKVRGVVPNPERKLKAEMLATALFERTLSAGVVIPASALMLRGARHSVFVQVQPGVFEAREVVIGHEGPKQVIVARGLEVGEQVVSGNMLLLARQFRLLQEDAKGAGAPAAETATTAARKASQP